MRRFIRLSLAAVALGATGVGLTGGGVAGASGPTTGPAGSYNMFVSFKGEPFSEFELRLDHNGTFAICDGPEGTFTVDGNNVTLDGHFAGNKWDFDAWRSRTGLNTEGAPGNMYENSHHAGLWYGVLTGSATADPSCA